MKRKYEKRLILLISLFAIFTLLITPGILLTLPANRKIEAKTNTFENISITNKYGNNIKGWYAESNNRDKAILLLHPLRCSRMFMESRAQFLLKNGYSVCLIDMQAHGETKGEKVTFGYKESDDVIATVNYLKRVMGYKKIGILGTSLGGAAALYQSKKIKADAIILESVYPEIRTAIDNRVKMHLGPLSKIITPILVNQIKPILKIDPSELNPLNHINDNTAPKFVISGKEDKRTTEAETLKLYEKIKSEKELWLLDNAKHEDLYKIAPKDYEEKVLSFFNKYLQTDNVSD